MITLNGGAINLVSSDDGLNVAGGNDTAGMGGRTGGRPGQDTFTASEDQWLYINGGTLAINSGGDGIDVNGSIAMTDGQVIVNGPTENMNGALDHDGAFTISGGFLVAAGSAGMAQAPGTTSTQPSVLINANSAQAAGTLVHIQSDSGETILTFAPSKQYQSIAFSSPLLQSGATYEVSYGGTAGGTVQNGLYLDGAYEPGSYDTSFTVTEMLTTLGNTGRRFGELN